MTLRIGVVVGRKSETEGGWWTVTTALSGALKNARTTNEYVFLDDVLEPPAVAGVRRHSKDTYSQLFGRARRAGARIARKVLPQSRIPEAGATYAQRIHAVVAEHKLDAIWLMSPPGVPLAVPFAATVWDLEHRKQPYFPEVGWSWEERERSYATVLPRASFIVTGTQVGKDEIVHYYRVNPENVKVIASPLPGRDMQQTSLDIGDVRRKFGIDGDFLFYPAQFWPHKNHVNLLIALDLLRRRDGLRLSLVLTGSEKGNRQHVLDKARDLAIADQVFDLGFVSREELNTFYKNAAALVYPSLFGPDNIPPLEAFSLRCPVVASRIPGAEEQLAGGALLFDPVDPVDIADKILALTSNPDMRRTLIEEGASIASSRTPERYITQIDDMFDRFASIRRCWSSA